MRELDKWIAREIMVDVRKQPCAHIGCFNHVTHPCEGCGYTGGILIKPYTTDLRRSFEAAKKWGLWEFDRVEGECVIRWNGADFQINWVEKYAPKLRTIPFWHEISSHENPATAIALAIYKLQTGKDWDTSGEGE